MPRNFELTREEVAALVAAAAAVLTCPEQAPEAAPLLPYLDSAGAKLAAACGKDWAEFKSRVAQGYAPRRN